MLVRLLSAVRRDEFRTSVISLTDRGDFGERIEMMGIDLRTIGVRRSFPSPAAFLRLRDTLASLQPDVVQTWMYHADLLGGLAARSLGIRKVVWGLRQSNLSLAANRATTMFTIWLCARLSGSVPSRIVCGSNAARNSHGAIGYSEQLMHVIPNGFDLDLFRPSPVDRESVREELGTSPGAPLIGIVARLDPQKDHRNFIAAAGRLHRNHSTAEFVLCGEGMSPVNETLVGWIEELGGGARFHLIGRRDDIARLTAAFDIAVSSSFGEGFSNAIGEAMASGVPCVVTDVGDSASIVAETGIAVPPRDSEALAAAIERMLDFGAERRRELGAAARRRIEEKFSLGAVARMYEALWRELSPCAG